MYYRLSFCLAHPVTEFSKKTGDYVSLSSVDLKLIALVYQLECELGPEKGRNLRESPIHQPSPLEVCNVLLAQRVCMCLNFVLKSCVLIFKDSHNKGMFAGNIPGFYRGPSLEVCCTYGNVHAVQCRYWSPILLSAKETVD